MKIIDRYGKEYDTLEVSLKQNKIYCTPVNKNKDILLGEFTSKERTKEIFIELSHSLLNNVTYFTIPII